MSNWPALIEGMGIVAAATVSVIGAFVSIKNRKTDAKKIESETSLNATQQAEIVKRLADSTEEMYIQRIDSLKDDIKLLREELRAARGEVNEVRDEAALLEDYFFNHHQPWDRKFVQQAREKGWEIDDPPSWLIFLREKSRVRDSK